MKERNRAIELLRILLMFGIVMIHVIGKGAYSQRWLANLLKICVPGFVFITGWFGLQFSWRKIGKLYAIGAYCALVGTIFWALMLGESVTLQALCDRWLTDMKWFWFLHSYAVLLMVAPMLNIAVEKVIETRERIGGRDAIGIRQSNILLPFLVVVFGWAFLTGIGHIKPYMVVVDGFQTHSPLSLAGVYVVARCIKLGGIDNRFSSRLLLGVLIVCAPLAMIGLANYNSPIALIMAAALFLLFKRHVKAGAWVNIIAPSMFSVYMLHSTLAGLTFICRTEDCLMARNWNMFVMFLAVSLLVFGVGVLLATARRLVVRIWTKD